MIGGLTIRSCTLYVKLTSRARRRQKQENSHLNPERFPVRTRLIAVDGRRGLVIASVAQPIIISWGNSKNTKYNFAVFKNTDDLLFNEIHFTIPRKKINITISSVGLPNFCNNIN